MPGTDRAVDKKNRFVLKMSRLKKYPYQLIVILIGGAPFYFIVDDFIDDLLPMSGNGAHTIVPHLQYVSVMKKNFLQPIVERYSSHLYIEKETDGFITKSCERSI